MMTHEEIMAWGEEHSYPFLAIGQESDSEAQQVVLRHGRVHYVRLKRSPRRMALTAKRIARWNAMVAKAQVNTAIAHVDEMLKSCSNVVTSTTESEVTQ